MDSRNEALATVDQWFLPSQDGQFDLYVREEGAGRPVVVVHGGFGVEHSELVEPMSCLAAFRRVIWYDQRGSIRSPYASQEQMESITYDAHVDDLIALLTEVGPADVVAHSMGTLVAMSAMARTPELMLSVIMVGAIPPVLLESDDPSVAKCQAWRAERDAVSTARITELGLDKDSLTAKEQQLRWRIVFAAINAVSDDAWLTIKWPGRAWYREAVAGMSCRGMPQRQSLAPILNAYPGAVTVVLGDQDYVDFGATAWSRLAAANDRLSLHVIADCGHSPWYDQPTEFRAILEDALP